MNFVGEIVDSQLSVVNKITINYLFNVDVCVCVCLSSCNFNI